MAETVVRERRRAAIAGDEGLTSPGLAAVQMTAALTRTVAASCAAFDDGARQAFASAMRLHNMPAPEAQGAVEKPTISSCRGSRQGEAIIDRSSRPGRQSCRSPSNRKSLDNSP